MDFKVFIRGKIGELIILFSVPLFFCYLIPFPYYFIAIALSWVISFLVLYYRGKEESIFDKKSALQGFLVSFYAQLCQQATFKQAYEISNKYLNSYYQIRSFEEMVEDPAIYGLDKEESFIYALEKEKNNEGMLSNFSLLYEEKSKQYDLLMELKNKRNKNHNLCLLSFGLGVFALSLVLLIYPNVKDSFNSVYYLIGSMVGLSFPLPLIEVDMLVKIKKENTK